jgi:hypothetical protein
VSVQSRSGRFNPGEKAPGTHWIGGWVSPWAGLDDVEKRKFLTLPEPELRHLGRPARSQSLYRLSYRASWKNDNIVQCSGYLISSEHQLYNVRPLKTPFGLFISLLQSQSHVTTITHNYLLRCATCTQLTIINVRDYNHLLHSYTGWLLSYQLLSQIITHLTSSHFETLAEILLREFTS